MPGDAYTSTSVLTNLVKTSFDKVVDLALWSEPMYRKFASRRNTDLTSPGSSVTWYTHSDLANATDELSETADPDAVALGNPAAINVALKERGATTVSTIRLREFSLSNIDTAQAELVARNMRNSLDAIVSAVLIGGDNVVYSNAGAVSTSDATANLTASDVMKAALVRYAVAKMRGASALEFDDGYFMAVIHPDVSHDLRVETGAAAWRDPHVYAENANQMIWKGEIGAFEGARFVETPRAYNADDGNSSATVHRTLFLGKEALAELVSIEPSVVVSPQTDAFRRFLKVGWYGLLGHGIWREECLYRVETGASI